MPFTHKLGECFKCACKNKPLFRQDEGPLTSASYWSCAEDSVIPLDPVFVKAAEGLTDLMAKDSVGCLAALGFDEQDLAD